MSGWQIRVRALHAMGGGPLPRRAFDPMDDTLGVCDKRGMTPAVAHGLATAKKVKYQWLWTLTPKGRDWCEGRLVLFEAEPKTKLGGRGYHKFKATWLKALPRAGEVRP